MITGPQLRAARCWLDWTRAELAKESGVSSETIKNIEKGRFHPHSSTQDALVQCFDAQGIEFIENEGVRKRPVCPNCGWPELNEDEANACSR